MDCHKILCVSYLSRWRTWNFLVPGPSLLIFSSYTLLFFKVYLLTFLTLIQWRLQCNVRIMFKSFYSTTPPLPSRSAPRGVGTNAFPCSITHLCLCKLQLLRPELWNCLQKILLPSGFSFNVIPLFSFLSWRLIKKTLQIIETRNHSRKFCLFSNCVFHLFCFCTVFLFEMLCNVFNLFLCVCLCACYVAENKIVIVYVADHTCKLSSTWLLQTHNRQRLRKEKQS